VKDKSREKFIGVKVQVLRDKCLETEQADLHQFFYVSQMLEADPFFKKSNSGFSPA